MEDEVIFQMAWHLTQCARLLKSEIMRKARQLPAPKALIEGQNKQNEDLERRKEAEYATEINSKLFGDDLTHILEQSLEDAKRKKKESEDNDGPA